MATRTKRYEIGKLVRLLVILVFAGNVVELAKWLDMVNVELSPQLLFSYSTMLTLAAVAPAGKPALFKPVGTVVRRVPALPRRVILAAPMLRAPFAFALLAAIEVLEMRQVVRLADDASSARGTPNLDPPVLVVVGAGFVARKPTGAALVVAKVPVIYLRLPGATLQSRATFSALHLNRATVPARGFGTNQIARPPLVSASLITKVVLSVFCVARKQRKGFPAVCTRNLYLAAFPSGRSFAAHMFRPPLRVTLAAATVMVSLFQVIRVSLNLFAADGAVHDDRHKKALRWYSRRYLLRETPHQQRARVNIRTMRQLSNGVSLSNCSIA